MFPAAFISIQSPKGPRETANSSAKASRKGSLHLLELFFRAGRLRHLEHVEANSFRERPTFTDGDNVSERNVTETRRKMHGHVAVATLEPVTQ